MTVHMQPVGIDEAAAVLAAADEIVRSVNVRFAEPVLTTLTVLEALDAVAAAVHMYWAETARNEFNLRIETDAEVFNLVTVHPL